MKIDNMKKILINKQEWITYTSTEYICVIDDEIVYSFNLSTFDENETDAELMKDRFLNNVYVQPKYRRQGYFNEIMNIVLKECKGNIFLDCNKNNFILEKYKNFGFELFYNIDEDFNRYVKYQSVNKL